MKKSVFMQKFLSTVLAFTLALQTGISTVTGFAAQTGSESETLSSAPQEVTTTTDVWNTPQIPLAAKMVDGVEQSTITLNETTGDGTWKFLFESPNGIPLPTAANQDFDFSAWTSKEWHNIKVPGEILMQGFDILNNTEYYYQRDLQIPADYADSRILIRFDGVYSNARVWVNGKYVRTHVGGFTSWDCDITNMVTPGETVTLTVGVADLYRNNAGIWNTNNTNHNNPANATEYAHHNIGGILRDVHLMALPKDYIARVYSNTDFDANFEDATLEITAQLGMISDKATLKVEVLDGDEPIAAEQIPFVNTNGSLATLPTLITQADSLLKENKDNLYEGNQGKSGQYAKAAYEMLKTESDKAKAFTSKIEPSLTKALKVKIPVSSPKKWDAEHPNLYTLRTTLLVNGKEKQVNEEKIGFREIHYGGKDGTAANKVYVNAKEVKLRGTCRHDVSYDLGRSTTREQDYAEALAYKKANINFIRTSHYPISENLLDACDELGIYVEQESAVCFQGVWGNQILNSEADYLNQFTEMIERDRNRASILIWSLGNESDFETTPAFRTEYNYVKVVETTRPVIFSFPDTVRTSPKPYDIYSIHYANVSGNLGRANEPVLHDEFAHIPCYNLDELQRDVNVRNFWGESIKKGWENLFTADGGLGVALWGGIDDVFYIPDGTSERWQKHSDGQTAGYGEWGSVLDAYMREKPEAYLTKKAYSPVRVDEDSCFVENGKLNIPVKNWFDHTNINELKLEVTVDDGDTQKVNLKDNIAPHSNGTISVSGISEDAKNINLKFYTPDGIMVDESNLTIEDVNYNFTPAGNAPPVINQTDTEILVTGTNFSITFSKNAGLITKAKYGEDVLITGGPYLNINGVSDTDWVPNAQDGITAVINNNLALVTLTGAYKNGQGVKYEVKISSNGIITTDYTLTTTSSTSTQLKEVGLSYSIPENIESVDWLRDGLYSAYPEDHIGRNKGTAFVKRENADSHPDQYGVKPNWAWKDDMKNYFVYSTEDKNNGIATNDFKTMRENVRYYDVNYKNTASHISVESQDASVAARVDYKYDLGYIDDRDPRLVYNGGWGKFDSSADYAGTESYSTALGATCEFTFDGTGIRFIGSKQNNVGKVKVYLDGVLQEEVDTYSNLGGELKQSVIFSKDNLENGAHTIKLETSGGKYNCIVVDAFEVLTEQGDAARLKSKLIINNQWYYPGLAWGNYFGKEGRISSGYKATSTLRLTDRDNLNFNQLSVSDVVITEEANSILKVTYAAQNCPEDTQFDIQWYRVRVGDPDAKAQSIEGANGTSYNASNEAAKIYCTVTPKTAELTGTTIKSNELSIGGTNYKYHDITDDSLEMVFTVGVKGQDYKTDRDESWTANAYNKTVTYLLDGKALTELSFTFTGSGIRWIGAKENNQGIPQVVIDNGAPLDVDLFDANSSTGNQINEILFEKMWDSSGEHTITIKRTNNRNEGSSAANVSLDAFIVINKDGIVNKVQEVVKAEEIAQATNVKENETQTTEPPKEEIPTGETATDHTSPSENPTGETPTNDTPSEENQTNQKPSNEVPNNTTPADGISSEEKNEEQPQPKVAEETETQASSEHTQSKVLAAYTTAELDNMIASLTKAINDFKASIFKEIVLSNSAVVLPIKDTVTLTASVTPVNEAVKWVSSNTKVATVTNGVVTAKSLGIASINASTIDGKFTAVCVVTVVPKSITGHTDTSGSDNNRTEVIVELPSAYSGDNVSLSITDVTNSQASGIGVGSQTAKAVYNIQLLQNGLPDTNVYPDGFTVKIKLPDNAVELHRLAQANKLDVYYVNGNQKTLMPTHCLKENGSYFVIFTTQHFSTYAILERIDKVTSHSGSTTSKPKDQSYEAWQRVMERIGDAAEGDTITARIQSGATIPAKVIDLLAGKDVTLVIDNGKDELKLNGNTLIKTDMSRIYFTFEELAKLKETEKLPSGSSVNPETGGGVIVEIPATSPTVNAPAAVTKQSAISPKAGESKEQEQTVPSLQEKSSASAVVWLIAILLVAAGGLLAGCWRYISLKCVNLTSAPQISTLKRS